jgi:hypothetical protein
MADVTAKPRLNRHLKKWISMEVPSLEDHPAHLVDARAGTQVEMPARNVTA